MGARSPLHLLQQLAACAHGPHDRVLTGALLARRGDCGKQHHQACGQRESEQELHRADDLAQHLLELGHGGAQVDVGDVGKLAHQRIVKARGVWRAVGGQVGHGDIIHLRDRVHHEEVRAHRSPVHLAQAGDPALVLHAAHVKQQAVADFQAQRFGNTFFDTDAPRLARRPPALHDLVVLLQHIAVGDVELAVDKALGAVFAVVARAHVPAIDLDEAAAHHRVPVPFVDAGLAQPLLEGVGLVRQDVDDKAVHCIGRRRLPPGLDQVGAQQHQQHQGHQADSQAADLDHGKPGPGGHLAGGQQQPAWRRALVHPTAQQRNRRRAEQAKQDDGHRKTTDRNAAELGIATDQQQQGRKTQHPQQQHRGRRRAQGTQVTPQHAQRWHLGQLQHRWQAKGQQQGHAHAHTHHQGPAAGSGQGHGQQARHQPDKQVVHRIAQRDAQQAGRQADNDELDHIGAGNGALAQAQHPQECRAVEVGTGKGARRQRHGHGRQQRGQQGHQVQEFLRPLQGLLHLGPAALQRLDAHAMRMRLGHFGLGPLQKLRCCCGLTGHRKAVQQTAGGLYQTGRSQVAPVQHHARRKAQKSRPPVRLDRQHPANREALVSKPQHRTGLERQRLQQARVHPDFARRRKVAGGAIGLAGSRCGAQAAAQRVAGLHRLEANEAGFTAIGIVRAGHRRKGHRRDALQPQRLGLVAESRWCAVVADHHDIAAQQLAGIALQPCLQAVGEKAHGRQRRHGQRHRHQQQAQLTGAPVAQQLAPAQRKKVVFHAANITDARLPPALAGIARGNARWQPPAPGNGDFVDGLQWLH